MKLGVINEREECVVRCRNGVSAVDDFRSLENGILPLRIKIAVAYKSYVEGNILARNRRSIGVFPEVRIDLLAGNQRCEILRIPGEDINIANVGRCMNKKILVIPEYYVVRCYDQQIEQFSLR